MIEEDWADGAMVSSSEEGEILRWGRWWRCEEFSGDVSIKQVDFREGDILLWVEAFRGVGIA